MNLLHFAHARYSLRMIDRFLYWGDHLFRKSGKIKGSCQPPLVVGDASSLIMKMMGNLSSYSISSRICGIYFYREHKQWADFGGLFKILNSYDIIVSVIIVLYHLSSGLYYRLVSHL